MKKPDERVFHNLVIVSMKPRFPGHAQKIMYGLWGLGLMMLSKGFVIVDEDVDVHDLRAVADAVFQNVDWPRDVTIVDGPVDQLDHSAVRNSYGGKIGVDATRKPERHPGGQSVPVWATGDITEIVGENWTTYGDAVLVAAVDQATHPAEATIRALWHHIPNHIIVLLDADADVCDLHEVAWRALGNTDWRRDVVYSAPVDHFAPEDAPRGMIGINARAKGPEDGHPRGWPEEIVMDNQIVQRVNEKWDSYGIA